MYVCMYVCIYRVAQKKLTCLIKHNAQTKEFITRKTCSSLSLMSNLKFLDAVYAFFMQYSPRYRSFNFNMLFAKVHKFAKNGLKVP